MTEAFITPELVAWARNRCRMTPAAATRQIDKRFSSWEQGESRPTFRQAQTLARKLHIPFGYLFLSKPPTLEIPLPDLRSLRGALPAEPSVEFYDVLNDALRKHEWYRDYLENEGANPLPFVGRFSLDTPVDTVATDIRDTLAISQEIRDRASNWEEFLQVFIEKAEQIGVLVLRNSIVGNNPHRPLDVNEFRGFVISDRIAPLVFLNGADAKSAQIFTLAHELAHLWIGQSGISNPDYRKRAREQEHPIERVCDRIATEVLVPEKEFLSKWRSGLSLDSNVWVLTDHFKVSRVVILRRAFELEMISQETYWNQYEQLRTDGKLGMTKQGGGHFYRSLLTRNSCAFTTAIVGSVLEGRISEREAAYLLNVRVSTLDRFTKWMVGEL